MKIFLLTILILAGCTRSGFDDRSLYCGLLASDYRQIVHFLPQSFYQLGAKPNLEVEIAKFDRSIVQFFYGADEKIQFMSKAPLEAWGKKLQTWTEQQKQIHSKLTDGVSKAAHRAKFEFTSSLARSYHALFAESCKDAPFDFSL